MPAIPLFPLTGDEIYYPARRAFAITPHDTNQIAYETKGLYVGTTGAVKVTMYDGSEVTFTAVPAGAILPIVVKIVWSTGTTASTILGLA
jgi:hypothetical protein